MHIKKRTFIITASLSVFIVLTLALIMVLTPAKAQTNVIRVTTTTELQTAMKAAQPGDEIVIASGVYVGKLGSSASGYGSAFFNSDMEGAKGNPIIMRSEDPANPAELKGTSCGSCYALRITGDYWVLKDLLVTTAQKGIMLDGSSNSLVTGCTVTNVGMEGIHLRDGTCNTIVEKCTVTHTGITRVGMGEGLYIGSDKGSWGEYAPACDNNIVRECILGPYIDAEHVDIKEGTTGTIIENCIMDGTGISGGNYADSFIDIKGDQAIIRGNTFTRNGNDIIVDGVQLHNQLDSWGMDNQVYNNTFYLDNADCYVVNATNITTCEVATNKRIPTGNMYNGNVTEFTPPVETDVTASLTATVTNGKINAKVTTSNGISNYKYSYYIVKDGVVYSVLQNQQNSDVQLNLPKEAGTYQVLVYLQNQFNYIVTSDKAEISF